MDEVVPLAQITVPILNVGGEQIQDFDKKCIKKKERVRHLPDYCP